MAPGVPLLLGTNRDEATTLIKIDPSLTTAGMAGFIEGYVPGAGAAVVAEYPPTSFNATKYGSAAFWAANAAMADREMTCAARRTARWAKAVNSSGAFVYFYTHKLAITPLVELADKKALGVFHGR